jgi:hypothetical protein
MNQITYGQIGEEFCKCYYSRTIQGVNTAIDLFHPDVLCTVDGEEIRGNYNLLMKFVAMGIARFEYNNVTGTVQPTNNNELILTVNGYLKSVGYWNQAYQWIKFNEVFVLENIGSKIFIRNYMIRTV